MAERERHDFVAGEVLTAARLDAMPGGWIGYLQSTSNQTGITTEVDIAGLSGLNVTLEANRLYRVSAEFTIEAATKNERASVKIYKDTDLIVQRPIAFPAYPDLEARTTARISRLVTSLSGSFAFKVTMAREFIAALSVIANSNAPAFLIVEDLGAV
jgi:hypothetical protein